MPQFTLPPHWRAYQAERDAHRARHAASLARYLAQLDEVRARADCARAEVAFPMATTSPVSQGPKRKTPAEARDLVEA